MGAGDPLSELDALASLPRKHAANFGCVEKALAQHPDDRDLILGAVAHHADAELVSRFLEGRGIELRADALRRHRRGQCRCLI